jgi:hypothetical protein
MTSFETTEPIRLSRAHQRSTRSDAVQSGSFDGAFKRIHNSFMVPGVLSPSPPRISTLRKFSEFDMIGGG